MKLDDSHKIEQVLRLYPNDPIALRHAKAACLYLHRIKGPGAQKARTLHHQAQVLLDALSNGKIARVVKPR